MNLKVLVAEIAIFLWLNIYLHSSPNADVEPKCTWQQKLNFDQCLSCWVK